jgi:hypothetical protein
MNIKLDVSSQNLLFAVAESNGYSSPEDVAKFIINYLAEDNFVPLKDI